MHQQLLKLRTQMPKLQEGPNLQLKGKDIPRLHIPKTPGRSADQMRNQELQMTRNKQGTLDPQPPMRRMRPPTPILPELHPIPQQPAPTSRRNNQTPTKKETH